MSFTTLHPCDNVLKFTIILGQSTAYIQSTRSIGFKMTNVKQFTQETQRLTKTNIFVLTNSVHYYFV